MEDCSKTQKGGIKSVRLCTPEEEKEFFDKEGFLFKNSIIKKEGDQILTISTEDVERVYTEFKTQGKEYELDFVNHELNQGITLVLKPSNKPYWEILGFKSEEDYLKTLHLTDMKTLHCFTHNCHLSKCQKRN